VTGDRTLTDASIPRLRPRQTGRRNAASGWPAHRRSGGEQGVRKHHSQHATTAAPHHAPGVGSVLRNGHDLFPLAVLAQPERQLEHAVGVPGRRRFAVGAHFTAQVSELAKDVSEVAPGVRLDAGESLLVGARGVPPRSCAARALPRLNAAAR
jgi:hypothetical protein